MKKKKKKKMEVRPISVSNCSGVFQLLWECRWVENYSQTMIIHLKRLKSSKFVRVKAFPMYGGIGVSAPSLHRESTDSLITHALALSQSICRENCLFILLPMSR